MILRRWNRIFTLVIMCLIGVLAFSTPQAQVFPIFRVSDGVVFMTAVALNLRVGTSVRADWQFGSDLVYSNSWVAPQSEQYRCVALAMRPSNTEFMIGNWSVTLSVDGEATEPRSFTILDG